MRSKRRSVDVEAHAYGEAVARLDVPLKRGVRGACASSASIAANSFSMARADGAKRLVEANRLRELLPDEFVTLRQFDVLCKRPIDTLGVRTIQSPGRSSALLKSMSVTISQR